MTKLKENIWTGMGVEHALGYEFVNSV